MLDDFREWLSDNLRYILLGLAVILIIVIGFCVVKLVTGGSSDSDKPAASGTTESEISTEAVTEAPAVQGETAAVGTSALTKDDAAILTLVKKYYNAAAAKDVTVLEAICDPWNDKVKESILQNDVIESYNNISTYSKKGPVDNSYVVYNYYEAKVANINTPVPSLSLLYLTTNSAGELVVSDRNASQEVADYIQTVTSDADVKALREDVDEQCEHAKESDPALKEFMDALNDSEGSGSSSGNGDTGTAVSGEMVATSELNIRQEPSTNAVIMGIVTNGATVTVLQEVEDGWCQISYNAGSYNIEGYVKLEYLTSAGGNGSSADDTDTADAAGTAGSAGTAATGGSSGTADTPQV